jgi:hypothetical protein
MTAEEQLADAEKELTKTEQRRERLEKLANGDPELIGALVNLENRLKDVADRNPLLTKESIADFTLKFERFRKEDQKSIVDYLNAMTELVKDFIEKYTVELDKQIALREKQNVVLDEVKALIEKEKRESA